MAETLTEVEREQLLQTVKMFEAIAESQPDDYRSLEILDEAYAKLGREEDALRTAVRMAKAYARGGLISKAILAYEGLLQKNPKDAESAAALKELSSRMEKAAEGGGATPSAGGKETPKAPVPGTTRMRQKPRAETPREDPDLMLGKFMVNQHLITSRQLEPIYLDLRKNGNNNSGHVPALSLIELLQDRGLIQAETFLEMLIEKFRIPHIPLQAYDVDADIVKLVPRDLCFRYLAVPFDHISRTLLMSVVNPYARAHFEPLAEKLNLTIQWYLNTPQQIKAVLQVVYRLDRQSTKED